MFESFLAYQGLLQREFARFQKRYGFEIVDANRGAQKVQRDLRARLSKMLGIPVK
jgi:dTMP kinase